MMTYKIAALVLVVGLGIATAQAPAGPIRVSSGVSLANRITMVQPQYPQEAKDARIQGSVHLDVVISKSGVPTEIRVLSGPPGLSEASVQAVTQWRWNATLLNREPVEIITEVEINFTLAN